MLITVDAVVEYNDAGYLVYAGNFPGAFARGRILEEAREKMDGEIRRYVLWAQGTRLPQDAQIMTRIVQEKRSSLQVCDADSDVLFDSERPPMEAGEYAAQKTLAIRSASDFQKLYDAVPDRHCTCLPARQTFYGARPRTAEEMYLHTNNVTSYYVGEIGVNLQNTLAIAENRRQAFRLIECVPGFLNNAIFDGSYNEQWSLRKVLRRFLWHDRIHARALWRMATRIWGADMTSDPYHFAD